MTTNCTENILWLVNSWDFKLSIDHYLWTLRPVVKELSMLKAECWWIFKLWHSYLYHKNMRNITYLHFVSINGIYNFYMRALCNFSCFMIKVAMLQFENPPTLSFFNIGKTSTTYLTAHIQWSLESLWSQLSASYNVFSVRIVVITIFTIIHSTDGKFPHVA